MRLSVIKPLVAGGISYLRTDLYPALGLLMCAGLAAAGLALYVFAGLAAEVREGDIRHFDEAVFAVAGRAASPALTSFMSGITWPAQAGDVRDGRRARARLRQPASADRAKALWS